MAQLDVEVFVRRVFTDSWDLFKRDPALYILAGLVVVVLGAVTLGLLAGPLMVGFVQLVRERRRGVPRAVGDLFGGLSGRWLSALLLTLVVAVGVVLGSMLLVLPGLVVAFVAMYAYQVLAYRGAGVGESLTGSYHLVRDQLGPSLVLFLLLAVLNTIGGAVIFGSLLTLPFTLVALTVAFEELTRLPPVTSVAREPEPL